MQICSRNCVSRDTDIIGFYYNFLTLIRDSGKYLLCFLNLTYDVRPRERD